MICCCADAHTCTAYPRANKVSHQIPKSKPQKNTKFQISQIPKKVSFVQSQLPILRRSEDRSISVFGGLELRQTYCSSDSFYWVHRKAEASFAHHDITVHLGASMFQGATEPRGSVWSARSLLPLWRLGPQRCFLRGSIPATQKVRCSPAEYGNTPKRRQRTIVNRGRRQTREMRIQSAGGDFLNSGMR